MFRWCSFCNRFLGEATPFDDVTFTHGICPACLKGRVFREDLSHAKRAADFMRGLVEHVVAGKDLSIEETLAAGTELGLRPGDLFLGILQPTLQEVGKLFSTGQICIAFEHKFSEFVGRLTQVVESLFHLPQRPRAILAVVPGNGHDLGVRMLALFLRDHGIPCEIVDGGDCDAEELAALLLTREPRVVGFSSSMPQQRLELEKCLWAMRALASKNVEIVVGGRGTRELEPGLLPVHLDPLSSDARLELFGNLLDRAA